MALEKIHCIAPVLFVLLRLLKTLEIWLKLRGLCLCVSVSVSVDLRLGRQVCECHTRVWESECMDECVAWVHVCVGDGGKGKR